MTKIKDTEGVAQLKICFANKKIQNLRDVYQDFWYKDDIVLINNLEHLVVLKYCGM